MSKYMPPNKRNPALAPQVMAPVVTVRSMQEQANWIYAQNGAFFFPAQHIHITVPNAGSTYVAGNSIYATVNMVAISDGQQHANGGGTGFFPHSATQVRRIAAMNSIGAAAVAKMNQLAADLVFPTVGP